LRRISKVWNFFGSGSQGPADTHRGGLGTSSPIASPRDHPGQQTYQPGRPSPDNRYPILSPLLNNPSNHSFQTFKSPKSPTGVGSRFRLVTTPAPARLHKPRNTQESAGDRPERVARRSACKRPPAGRDSAGGAETGQAFSCRSARWGGNHPAVASRKPAASSQPRVRASQPSGWTHSRENSQRGSDQRRRTAA